MVLNKLVIKISALIWLIIISVLFFLPGSALPKVGLFGIPYFDKYVHFGFFAVLLFLWRFYFMVGSRYTFLLMAMAFCYGIGVEVVQHYFIANRSFDFTDVIADMMGAAAGVLVWQWYIKNRPL